MYNFLQRYIQLYNELGIKTLFINDILFYEYSKMIIPIGPIKFDYVLNKEDLHNIFRYFLTL